MSAARREGANVRLGWKNKQKGARSTSPKDETGGGVKKKATTNNAESAKKYRGRARVEKRRGTMLPPHTKEKGKKFRENTAKSRATENPVPPRPKREEKNA